jgi:catechol 2,3-dioxygenase-like lactoylglutathione lyase family enzyme
MILAFAHPSIVVPDLEDARAFYQAMFGFKVLTQEGWSENSDADSATGLQNSSCRGYMLSGHNCFLELFEFSTPQQCGPMPQSLNANEQGIRHLAFYVDDVKKETQRFLSLGGSSLGNPIGNAVYLRDPFGNIIELCEIPSEEEHPTNLAGVSCLDTFLGD